MTASRLLLVVALGLGAGCDSNYCSALVHPIEADGGDDGPGAYPAGPYGSDVGSVIANLAIAGTQRDDNGNGTPLDDVVGAVNLDDYRRDPSLRVLAILVAAEWCLPCQNEQPELVSDYGGYRSAQAGVAMLEAITQDQKGNPATKDTTASWVSHFHVPFDITFDQGGALAPYSDPATYPAQIVIRLSDMTIRWTHSGYEPGALKDAIDSVLGK